MEKERGIPVQMLNDREKVNRPNSQVGMMLWDAGGVEGVDGGMGGRENGEFCYKGMGRAQ